jgi:hypothetical protein
VHHHGHSAPPGKAKPAHHAAAPIVHAVAPTPAALKPAKPVHAGGRVLHRPATIKPATLTIGHDPVAPGQLKKTSVPLTPAAEAPAAPRAAVQRAAHAAKHTAVKAKTSTPTKKAATLTRPGKHTAKAKGHAKPALHGGPKVERVVTTPTQTTTTADVQTTTAPADPTQPANGNANGRGNGKGDG